MIPLRDENPSRTFPWVTATIVAANAGVFAYQAFFGPRGFPAYVNAFGVVPAILTGKASGAGLTPATLFSPRLLSSMFMHGGVLHLLGNLWFLWIFGDNVEEKLTRGRYLLFYLLAGVLATLAHVVAEPGSALPLVGASGAIAGVLGAYFLFFPFHRIVVLVPIFILFTTVRVPAMLFLGLWFLMQLAYSSMGGVVAWWAHIGGFAAGVGLAFLFAPRRR
jgi:membrane associated rhomboid family serine protease